MFPGQIPVEGDFNFFKRHEISSQQLPHQNLLSGSSKHKTWEGYAGVWQKPSGLKLQSISQVLFCPQRALKLQPKCFLNSRIHIKSSEGDRWKQQIAEKVKRMWRCFELDYLAWSHSCNKANLFSNYNTQVFTNSWCTSKCQTKKRLTLPRKLSSLFL